MIAQIVVFSRKNDAQRKKNFEFHPQKLRKSFANGNPTDKVCKLSMIIILFILEKNSEVKSQDLVE